MVASVEGAVAYVDEFLGTMAPPVACVATTNLAGVRVGSIFTVTATGALIIDNVPPAAGQRVLLANQTTLADSLIYTVVSPGGVGAHPVIQVAPECAIGTSINTLTVVVCNGSEWADTDWRALAGQEGLHWGTDDPSWYPREIDRKVALVSGSYKMGAGVGGDGKDMFILAGFNFTSITRNTVGGTVTATVCYAAPDATKVTGRPGIASLTVQAEVAAGTINSADTSTLDVVIKNWGGGIG